MKCRSCGLEIAEKAIVCYRCGTPTAETPPVQRAGAARRTNWPGAAIALIIIALAVWLVPYTPSGTIERWGAWAAVAVAGGATALWLRRQRGAGGRRR